MTVKKTKRPRLTGITLDVLYPDGNTRTITVDPNEVEALFWSDRTVLEIFAPYYESKETYITKDEMIARFGEKGETLVQQQDKVKVTKELIKEMWETESTDGYLPVTLGKTTDCLPT